MARSYKQLYAEIADLQHQLRQAQEERDCDGRSGQRCDNDEPCLFHARIFLKAEVRDAAGQRALADEAFDDVAAIRTEVLLFLHWLDNDVFSYKVEGHPSLLHAEDLIRSLENIRKLVPTMRAGQTPAEAQEESDE